MRLYAKGKLLRSRTTFFSTGSNREYLERDENPNQYKYLA